MKNLKELIEFAETLAIPFPEEMDINSYQHIDINFSGGKDSIAMALILLYGYKLPRENMKLIHMRIDGPNQEAFFDYPCDLTYNFAVLASNCFNILSAKLYFNAK
ncbi:hypothetical protein M3936_19865 [Sutcliffiella horikoshii]|uniref:hypothetical protein n=1 Tax=Sutcliffiella horikoshii TaxID=79883 RepID=UPI00203FA15D|nr:hypothetical protein [Sutcliffiella horikoshii]MCM3619832.1 hypothetical protein [Sutcliffiella horikoshii]